MKYLIGDKVKTDFGEGVICNYSDSLDMYHVRTDKKGVILRHSMSLEKLPKYAFGDVVRSKTDNEIFQITMVLGQETYLCGDVCFIEDAVEPFDGFRIGDTVWTVKRGKGKIIGNVYDNTKRPFAVDFSAPNGRTFKWYTYDGIFYPKLSNLIPTEAKYKEALRLPKVKAAGEAIYEAANAFAAAVGRTAEQLKKFPSGGVVETNPTYTRKDAGKMLFVADTPDKDGNRLRTSKFAVGEKVLYCCQTAEVTQIQWEGDKFTYNLNSNSFPDNIPEESLMSWNPYIAQAQVAPSSKFKEGDVVYFSGIGFWLTDAKTPNKYIVKDPNAGGGYVTLTRWDNNAAATCKESDLRLWKETEFEILVDDGITLKSCAGFSQPFCYDEVRFIGKTQEGKDIFSAKTKSMAHTHIFYGTKGDDI